MGGKRRTQERENLNFRWVPWAQLNPVVIYQLTGTINRWTCSFVLFYFHFELIVHPEFPEVFFIRYYRTLPSYSTLAAMVPPCEILRIRDEHEPVVRRFGTVHFPAEQLSHVLAPCPAPTPVCAQSAAVPRGGRVLLLTGCLFVTLIHEPAVWPGNKLGRTGAPAVRAHLYLGLSFGGRDSEWFIWRSGRSAFKLSGRELWLISGIHNMDLQCLKVASDWSNCIM